MNQKRLVSWLLLGAFFGLSGCSVLYSPKPLGTFGAAELARPTNYTRDLDNLPPPKLVLPVAVYGFKDQSGQYKPQPDSSFSTAVSMRRAFSQFGHPSPAVTARKSTYAVG